MMNNYIYEHYSKFDKNCDKLFRKCPSLEEDLQRFKIALTDDLIKNNGIIPSNNKFFHVNKLKSPLPVFRLYLLFYLFL